MRYFPTQSGLSRQMRIQAVCERSGLFLNAKADFGVCSKRAGFCCSLEDRWPVRTRTPYAGMKTRDA
jgi:hypothetical protein